MKKIRNNVNFGSSASTLTAGWQKIAKTTYIKASFYCTYIYNMAFNNGTYKQM